MGSRVEVSQVVQGEKKEDVFDSLGPAKRSSGAPRTSGKRPPSVCVPK